MKQEHLAIALGFFDGVHQGHGALLEQVAQYAEHSAVLTFDGHPATLLQKTSTPLLSSIEDRTWLITTKYKISQVIVAEFLAIHNMDWKDFVTDYLKEQLHVTHIVAGHDFRFGKDGLGTPEKLQEICQSSGMTCHIVPPVTVDNVLVSSTHIRTLLQQGELELANKFLGHPHVLSNTVEHGNKIGSMVLGFPTVNLSIPESVIVPAFGVYACRILIENQGFYAVANVGIRPTVEETDKKVTVEGFLLDFPEEELYGRNLRVEFYHYLRPERKFDNFAMLSAQIQKDVQSTRDYFDI